MWMRSKGVTISMFTSAFAWHYLNWNFETSSWILFFSHFSEWKVCARTKANRTDILLSKCSRWWYSSMVEWFKHWTCCHPVQAPPLTTGQKILTQSHEFSIDIMTFEGLLAKKLQLNLKATYLVINVCDIHHIKHIIVKIWLKHSS